MSFLVLEAYATLIYFDFYLARGNFAVLYQKVRNYPIGTSVEVRMQPKGSAPQWTWRAFGIGKKCSVCRRSAATACLLKRYGVPAQMVIGAQQMPFKAHAWVEVNGRVVNDKPYMREMYAVLDRC